MGFSLASIWGKGRECLMPSLAPLLGGTGMDDKWSLVPEYGEGVGLWGHRRA